MVWLGLRLVIPHFSAVEGLLEKTLGRRMDKSTDIRRRGQMQSVTACIEDRHLTLRVAQLLS